MSGRSCWAWPIIFVLLTLFVQVISFKPSAQFVHVRSSILRASSIDGNGRSPLPEFTDLVTPKKPESPLVDRALDSALDFLQDGEVEDDEDDEFDMFDIYEESPDIEIPYDLIAELEEKEAVALANKGPTAFDMNQIAIKSSVEKWRKHDKDCGSAEVQVAIANERIKYLTKHLLANKADIAARRGLNSLVTTRRKFLNYLYETDKAKAEKMVKELGIRFRPPGRLWDKEAKYGAFKNTKSKWQKLKMIARQQRDAKSSPVSALAK